MPENNAALDRGEHRLVVSDRGEHRLVASEHAEPRLAALLQAMEPKCLPEPYVFVTVAGVLQPCFMKNIVLMLV